MSAALKLEIYQNGEFLKEVSCDSIRGSRDFAQTWIIKGDCSRHGL
jgi:hypothetical protein